MKQFEYVCAYLSLSLSPRMQKFSYPSLWILSSSSRIMRAVKVSRGREIFATMRKWKELKTKEEERERITHIYLSAIYASQSIEGKGKEFFSSINDSIIPYYAYMGSSSAYINAIEQQQQKDQKGWEIPMNFLSYCVSLWSLLLLCLLIKRTSTRFNANKSIIYIRVAKIYHLEEELSLCAYAKVMRKFKFCNLCSLRRCAALRGRWHGESESNEIFFYYCWSF